jgi:hypothetical protein
VKLLLSARLEQLDRVPAPALERLAAALRCTPDASLVGEQRRQRLVMAILAAEKRIEEQPRQRHHAPREVSP